MKSSNNIIKDIGVRASRDGHEYHVAWAARVSLELLNPMTELKAISLEGFSTQDAHGFGQDAMDIADLVKYFGGRSVKEAERIDVVQLKYSPAKERTDLSASDLAKTLKKFIETKKDIVKMIGKERADRITFFEFVSNRPIGKNLEQAILELREERPGKGPVKRQVDTLKRSIGNAIDSIRVFFEHFSITGAGVSLPNIISNVHRTIANWKGTNDLAARAGLMDICELVRRKSGISGALNNTINDIDILGELEINDIDDLYPVPQSFPDVNFVLERSFLPELEEKILSYSRPLVLHGSGGCGKTVVMQSLASRLSIRNITVLFDGFGGGEWRAPGDDRHLCERSILHIVNCLAARGLCDLVLPGISAETALRVASKRFLQAIEAARKFEPEINIILLLDAIDHSGMQAINTNTNSFAKLLLERLDVKPIDGIKIVVSCRSERIDIACGDDKFPEFRILDFSKEESAKLSKKRIGDISHEEISVLYSRSNGNPRCLDMLLTDGRPFDSGELEKDTELLKDLIRQRFDKAIRHAEVKGTAKEYAKMLITGLRLLPPPVPIKDLSVACGLAPSAVDSFFSDLFPLIDRTRHGLIFRDEPTETLAKEYVDKDQSSVETIVKRLHQLQSTSAYASRALPPLLVEYNKVDDLIALAFSKIFPKAAYSTVAVRNIKLARVIAAINACVKAKRNDDIFQLMMEAATTAKGSQRSDNYVHEFPDIAASIGDVEAVRRLFEAKVSWQGSRYSSHAIANIVGGNYDDAIRDAKKAIRWLNWSLEQKKGDSDTSNSYYEERDWIGAIFVFMVNGETEKIINWLNNKNPNKAYRFFSELLKILLRHENAASEVSSCKEEIISMAISGRIREVWCLAAITNNFICSTEQEKSIIKVLAENIEIVEDERNISYRSRGKTSIVDALIVVICKAIKLNMRNYAKRIAGNLILERPSRYEFEDSFLEYSNVVKWLIFSSLNAALELRKPNLIDIVPIEIFENLPKSIKKRGPKAIKAAILKLLEKSHKAPNRRKPKLKSDTIRELDNVYTYRVVPILLYSKIIREIVIKPNGKFDLSIFLSDIKELVESAIDYPYRDQRIFLAYIGINSVSTVANAVRGWTEKSSRESIEWIKESPIRGYNKLLKILDGLTLQPNSDKAALELTQYTLSCIKTETDINNRIRSLGILSQLVWRISREEAKEIFREGLELADAIGSDSYDEIELLVHIAASYHGNKLPAETVHTLNRICELNFSYEPEKFIWTVYGKALSRIGGAATIAILSRLADKNKTSLGYSLPPLLTNLINDKNIDADLAASIIGIDRLTETWSWRFYNFIEIAFKELTQEQKEEVANWTVIEIDKVYQSNPLKDTLKELVKIFKENKAPMGVRHHLEKIQSYQKEDPYDLRESQFYGVVGKKGNVKKVKFEYCDTEALEKELLKEIDPENKAFAGWDMMQQIIFGITSVDEIIKLLRATSKVSCLSLDVKLKVFQFAFENWGRQSIAVKKAITETVFESLRISSVDLLSEGWKVESILRKINELVDCNKGEILPAIIKSLQKDLVNLNGVEWLRFASFFASYMHAGTLGKSLVRYINHASADLPEDYCEGPWTKDYLATNENRVIIAGFIWNQLGSPSSKLRWRASHAVLRLALIKRFDVINILINMIESKSPGPFVNKTLPFYDLHAKLWLSITLAKLSISHPTQLLKNRRVVEKCYKNNYDHVAIRYHLSFVLENLEKIERKAGYKERVKKLIDDRTPRFVFDKDRIYNRMNSYQGRPNGVEGPEETFSFDYDFKKYDINELGRLFGVHTWKVSDDISAVIRKIDPNITSMYDCPRDGRQSTWGRDSQKYTQKYGYYLAYHALLIVAGKYFKEFPVIYDDLDEDAWSSWISEYTLTDSWLAEQTDLFPVLIPTPEVDFSENSSITYESERKKLANICGFNKDYKLNKFVIINGTWSDSDGVLYQVSSTIVDEVYAKNLSYAIACVEPFFQYLPDSKDNFRWHRKFSINPPKMWILRNEEYLSRIDDTDPYGTKNVLRRPYIDNEVVSTLGLRTTDEFKKEWISGDNFKCFISRSWGTHHGEGRQSQTEDGDWLLGNRDIITKLLKQNNSNLVVLIKGRKFHEKARSESKFVTKTAVLIISQNGNYRVVQRIPKHIKESLNSLTPPERQDAVDCFNAIIN